MNLCVGGKWCDGRAKAVDAGWGIISADDGRWILYVMGAGAEHGPGVTILRCPWCGIDLTQSGADVGRGSEAKGKA